MSPDSNGWNEWSRHVLAELERLDGDITKLQEKVDGVKVAMAIMQVKVGLIAAASGLVGSAIITLVVRLLSK